MTLPKSDRAAILWKQISLWEDEIGALEAEWWTADLSLIRLLEIQAEVTALQKLVDQAIDALMKE